MMYQNTQTGEVYENVEAVYNNTSCVEYYDITMAIAVGNLVEIDG